MLINILFEIPFQCTNIFLQIIKRSSSDFEFFFWVSTLIWNYIVNVIEVFRHFIHHTRPSVIAGVTSLMIKCSFTEHSKYIVIGEATSAT